ncbi:MAG TPA: hypothetical protein VGN57_10400 [Pirellulaceae bacterium]|jgi:hypothetical protein|nr:hypothetical protein [Pirellulaceae bacterium]
MSIVSHGKYVAGWLDSSVGDMLGALPKASRSTSHALVTCLDSDPRPSNLLRRSPELLAIAKSCRQVGNGFSVPTSLLIERRETLFHGFDEVWFGRSEFVVPPPRQATIVGPDRVDAGAIGALGAWMSKSDCSLGLGDGVGLNVVAKASGLMRFLLAQTLAAAPPDTTIVTEPWNPGES